LFTHVCCLIISITLCSARSTACCTHYVYLFATHSMPLFLYTCSCTVEKSCTPSTSTPFSVCSKPQYEQTYVPDLSSSSYSITIGELHSSQRLSFPIFSHLLFHS